MKSFSETPTPEHKDQSETKGNADPQRDQSRIQYTASQQ